MQSAGRSSHELLAAVTVYYSVLQCVTVCYSVLQCVRYCCGHLCPHLSLSSSFSSLLDSFLLHSFLVLFGVFCLPLSYSFIIACSCHVLLHLTLLWRVLLSLSSSVFLLVSLCFPSCSPSCSLQFWSFLLCPHLSCSVSADQILSSCPLLLPSVPSPPFILSPSVLSSSLLSWRFIFCLLLPPSFLSSSDLFLLS